MTNSKQNKTSLIIQFLSLYLLKFGKVGLFLICNTPLFASSTTCDWGGIPKVIYVDSSNVGGVEDGTSWATAYSDLQDAIDDAIPRDSIWIAKGTYFPSQDINGLDSTRKNTFYFPYGIVIIGGFSGTETNVTQRDTQNIICTLSGDIGIRGDSSDNTLHVVTFENTYQPFYAWSIRVTQGNANAPDYGGIGGGALIHNSTNTVTLYLNHMEFIENFANTGGGFNVYADQGNRDIFLYLNKVSFIKNRSENSGGAIYALANSGNEINLEFIYCRFRGNYSLFNAGGCHLFALDGDIISKFINCEWVGNFAEGRGSALYQKSNKDNVLSNLTNNSFSGNVAGTQSTIYNTENGSGNSSMELNNVVLWGNSDAVTTTGGAITTFDHSLIEGMNPSGPGNLDGTNTLNDPLFIDQPDTALAPTCEGNLALKTCSPVVDAGDNDLLPLDLYEDLLGNIRIYNDSVDLGAYEFQGLPNPQNIYVDSSNSSGIKNGLSWQTAFTNLQQALDNACYKDTVRVAKGTYFPTSGFSGGADQREYSFHIDSSIILLGGYAADTSNPLLRNWKTYPTILSGDIGTTRENTDNCYTVMYLRAPDTCMLIDGFIVEKGYADGENLFNELAGGIVIHTDSNEIGELRLQNLLIQDNFGESAGGIINYCRGCQNSKLILKSITFRKNECESWGAGFLSFTNGGSTFLDIDRCLFEGNDGFLGGGLANITFDSISEVYISNSVWKGNSANEGSAIVTGGTGSGHSSMSLTNCSLSGNLSNSGATIINVDENSHESFLSIINSIIWGNSHGLENNSDNPLNISFSLIQDSFPAGLGNLDGQEPDNNPLFVNQPDYNISPSCNGNLQLKPCSPLINLGVNDSIPNGILYDLDGTMRIQDETVDLGAYENPAQENPHSVFYVDSTNIGGITNGHSWATAFTELQDAIDAACEKDTIWVARGTYIPTTDTAGIQRGRKNTFFIDKNIVLLGGFTGIETESESRNPELNQTILSGDRRNKGDSTDNVHHVMWIQKVDSCMLLDGFILQDGNADEDDDDEDSGAAILLLANSPGLQTSPTINDCRLINNTAISKGGAIYGLCTNSGILNPKLIDVDIQGNRSWRGGGIYFWLRSNGHSSPYFENCDISENSCTDDGAGIYISISNTTGDTLNALFKNCVVENNTASDKGGGFFIGGNESGNQWINIKNSTINTNSAEFGGGIYINGSEQLSSNVEIVHTKIQGNSAVFGGGIHWRASDGGGGSTEMNIDLTNCLITGNFADGLGGALSEERFLNDGAKMDLTINNSTLSGNSGSFRGGIDRAYNAKSRIFLNNSILWGNSGAEINHNDFFYPYHSLIEDINWGMGGNLNGLDSLNDPLFLNPKNDSLAPTVNGNYQLSVCSYSVNAGSNDTIPAALQYDLDSNARIQQGIVDIGAYENAGIPVISCNDITITLDDGEYGLNFQDSLDITLGSSPCFPSVSFENNSFNCLDLESTPIPVEVLFERPKGERDSCISLITLEEDPDNCCSYGQNSTSAYIDLVNMVGMADTLENLSGNNGGYANFTDSLFEVNSGDNIGLTVKSFSSNPISFKYWKVWIDWNQDGNYTNDELELSINSSSSSQNTTISTPIDVTGTRKMRVSMGLAPFSSPCQTHSIGEVENYLITFKECADILILENTTLSGAYRAQNQIKTQGQVIATGNTTFFARSFDLGKGFEIPAGFHFETVKNPCGLLQD